MCSSNHLNALLISMLALSLSGCPDPAPPKATVEGGTQGGGLIIEEADSTPPEGGAEDMGPAPDQGDADMAEPDMETPDMAEPDMEVPDMDPPPSSL